MLKKAIVFGINGYKLTLNEKRFFKKTKPWGLILFSRNIKSIKQLKKLIDDIKMTFNDNKYPILIDQEGGKVSRLDKIVDFSIFSQTYFANLYRKNKKLFYHNYKLYINNVSEIFKFVGININTVPVLDIFRKKSHSIIGSRSYSDNANEIINLANICIKLFKKNNIFTVIKHIPGHGLSKDDTHLNQPIISASKKVLIKNDFRPFKYCNSFFGMTCHAVYSAYDINNTATHSKTIINEVIRKHIGFRGILISDDISMKALKYNLEDNATKALEAGCNLILHCNGNINEMIKLSKVIPTIDKFTQKKTSHFYKFLV